MFCLKRVLILFVFLIFSIAPAFGEDGRNGYPVVLDEIEIYYIQAGSGILKPEERAKQTSQRLEEIAKDMSLQSRDIKVRRKGLSSVIYIGREPMAIITDADEKAIGIKKELYAKEVAKKIKAALIKYRERRSLKNYAFAVIKTILSTILFVLSLKYLWVYSAKIFKLFEIIRQKIAEKFHLRRFALLPAKLFISIINLVLNITRVGLFLLFFYFYVTAVLGFFPGTIKYEVKLVSQFQDVLSNIGTAVLDYIPHLVFVTIIVVTTYYVNQIVRYIFNQIKDGEITIEGFYSDWAQPTDKIVRFLIIAIGFAAIFPHLPGANTGAFQGVSVFLGVLVSLGSTAIVANIVSGILLIYTRSFKIGDIVRIADTVGLVEDGTLLVTRLKTIKNVVISIPNSIVLGSHIINYSSAVDDKGLILHTEVTIGYDVPWREVHRLLLEATDMTENILKDPKPFVWQTALGDYSVKYELNAYIKNPQNMPEALSEVHQNIMDKFNESNIEIMSPAYTAIRDGNTITVPEENRPKDYKPKGWIVK